jgi:hypothetical protein
VKPNALRGDLNLLAYKETPKSSPLTSDLIQPHKGLQSPK